MILIIPPGASLMPYPAVPYLAANLKKSCISTEVIDANIEAFNIFLQSINIQIEINTITTNANDHQIIIPENQLQHTMAQVFNNYNLELNRFIMSKVCMKDGEKEAIFSALIDSSQSNYITQNNYFSQELQNLSQNLIYKAGTISNRVVGIHVLGITSFLWAIYLAEEIKKREPSLLIVLGGHTIPKDVLHDFTCVDVVVDGEGENSLVEIVNSYKGDRNQLSAIKGIRYRDQDGEVLSTPARPLLKLLDNLPLPDYEVLEIPTYPQQKFGTNIMPIVGSRGCIAQCDFCLEWVIARGIYRQRSADNIVSEVKYLSNTYNTKYIRFNDSLINADLDRLDLLSKLLAQESSVEWMANARLRPEMTKERFDLLYKSGCRALWFGLESGSEQVLSAMRKRITLGEAQRVIRDAATSGIFVLLFIIVNHPYETDKDFENTLQFLNNNAPYIDALSVANFHIIPGSLAEKNLSNYPTQYNIHRNRYMMIYKPCVTNHNDRKKVLTDMWDSLDHRNSGQFPFIPIVPSI